MADTLAIESRLLGLLQLHLVDVSVVVADHGWHPCVGYAIRLDERNHLRPKLRHTSLPGLRQFSHGAWWEEARVKAGRPGIALEQLSKAV